MKGYNSNRIKLSFLKEYTDFYVNEKKNTVCCTLTGYLNVPINGDSPVYIGTEVIKAVGVAKCSKEDKFDVERGKRIALAKAENKAYEEASKFLTKSKEHLEYITNLINLFENHSDLQITHNKEYIESVSDVNHPKYKDVLTPVKQGKTRLV